MTMPGPDYEARCRSSFEKQRFMDTLGARLVTVRPGEAVIELPFSSHLTQQHDFLHAGAITSIVDSACGYAALSLMPKDSAVLSVEFKRPLLTKRNSRTNAVTNAFGRTTPCNHGTCCHSRRRNPLPRSHNPRIQR